MGHGLLCLHGDGDGSFHIQREGWAWERWVFQAMGRGGDGVGLSISTLLPSLCQSNMYNVNFLNSEPIYQKLHRIEICS